MEYPASKKDLLAVLRLHNAAQKLATALPAQKDSKTLDDLIENIIANAGGVLPEAQGLTASYALHAYLKSFKAPTLMNKERIAPAAKLAEAASGMWAKVAKATAHRNAFVSVMAPTGTISAPLGCYDEGTTSIEPDYTLVKWKQLAGGGSLKMFNRLALEGLRSLGYAEDFVNEAALEVAGLDGLISAFQGNMDAVVNQLIVDPCNDQAGPVRLAWRRLLSGTESRSEIQEKVAYISNPANMSVLTADELTVINGSAHIESIPWLDKKDLPVFDCAATNGNGIRAISPAGHVLMLGPSSPSFPGRAPRR